MDQQHNIPSASPSSSFNTRTCDTISPGAKKQSKNENDKKRKRDSRIEGSTLEVDDIVLEGDTVVKIKDKAISEYNSETLKSFARKLKIKRPGIMSKEQVLVELAKYKKFGPSPSVPDVDSKTVVDNKEKNAPEKIKLRKITSQIEKNKAFTDFIKNMRTTLIRKRLYEVLDEIIDVEERLSKAREAYDVVVAAVDDADAKENNALLSHKKRKVMLLEKKLNFLLEEEREIGKTLNEMNQLGN